MKAGNDKHACNLGWFSAAVPRGACRHCDAYLCGAAARLLSGCGLPSSWVHDTAETSVDASPTEYFSGFVGFNDNVALKTSYRDFGARKYTQGATTNTSQWTAVSLGVVQGFQLDYGLTFFGKISVAQTATSGPAVVDATSIKTFATGLDYRLGKEWMLRTAYDAYPIFGGSKRVMPNFSTGIRNQW